VPAGVAAVVAAVSSDEDERFCNERGIRTTRVANSPLSFKWQAGLDYVHAHIPPDECDAVLILGSDDVLSEQTLDFITKQLMLDAARGTPCLLGFDDIFFHNVESNVSRYYTGYSEKRREPMGAGRCFPRAVLDAVDWRLWTLEADRSLDGQCWARLREAKVVPARVRTFSLRKHGLMLCDIKHEENITPLGRFVGLMPINNAERVQLAPLLK